MKKPKISIEKSCGIILYKTENGLREYLLLHYPGGHWDFAKGHVEKSDKSEEDTARRELEEETGITQIQIDPFYRNAMYYEFKRGRFEIVKKTVVFFLAESSGRDVTISHEHRNFIWLPYEKAHQKLTYDNAKDLLKLAEENLKNEK